MINDLITKYIATNKRLVLPGFGAFIRKDSGDVVLVEFLRKNDGVLSSLISAQNGIDEQEALAQIELYTAEIKRSVATTGSYFIEGLGRIFSSPNGVYELEYLPSFTSDIRIESGNLFKQEQETRAGSPEPVAASQIQETEKGPYVGNTYTPPQATSVKRVVEQAEHKPVRIQPLNTSAVSESIPPPAQPRPVYTKPVRQPAPQKRKKTDIVMIFAVLAAVIALAAIGFGFLNGNPVNLRVPVNPEVENIQGLE